MRRGWFALPQSPSRCTEASSGTLLTFCCTRLERPWLPGSVHRVFNLNGYKQVSLRHHVASDKTAHCRRRCVHVTNYSVNKHQPGFVPNTDADSDGVGSKWSLRALQEHLENHCDVQWHSIWTQVDTALQANTNFEILTQIVKHPGNAALDLGYASSRFAHKWNNAGCTYRLWKLKVGHQVVQIYACEAALHYGQ